MPVVEKPEESTPIPSAIAEVLTDSQGMSIVETRSINHNAEQFRLFEAEVKEGTGETSQSGTKGIRPSR